MTLKDFARGSQLRGAQMISRGNGSFKNERTLLTFEGSVRIRHPRSATGGLLDFGHPKKPVPDLSNTVA